MSRSGRKPKLIISNKYQLLGALAFGASLRDAAAIVGVDPSTVYRARRRDRDFATGVNRALAVGKVRLIRLITASRSWEAAAWFLERRYPHEFLAARTHRLPNKKDFSCLR